MMLRMTIVTISSKYQIVIPLTIREAFGISPGDKLQILFYDDRIALIPLKEIKRMRGFLQDLDTTILRVKDRL